MFNSCWCARLRIVLLSCGIWCLAACGGQSATTGPLTSVAGAGLRQADEPYSALAMPPTRSVAEAIAEVRAAAVPHDIEPAIFAQLQSRLVEELAARDDGGKLVSAPPTGELNAVDDLLLVNGTSGFRLEWTYRNAGDYNQDGLVGVNDITPIGQHYQVSSNGPDWGAAQAADGNHDGLITVSDITPIGQHYQAFVAGYNIYGADTLEGARSQVASTALPAVQSPGLLRLSQDLGIGGFAIYWVVPFDGDGIEGQESLPSSSTHDPVIVEFGPTVELATETFGAEGGLISGPVGSLLEGFAVEFPEGALPEPTAVSLGYNEGILELPLEGFSTPLVVLDTGEQRDFQLPVKLTTPYPSAGDFPFVAIPYAVDDDGRLELLGTGEGTVSGEALTTGTLHSGIFVIALLRPEMLNGQTGHFLTSFNPARDAFQVYNTGSVYNSGGECAGMSSFAIWYWLHHSDSRGDFYPRFMYNVGIHKGQDIIATRAFNSIALQYSAYCNDFLANRTAGDYYNWAVTRYTILITGVPVLIDLGKQSAPVGDGEHSVTAYGYDDGGLWIYDPNASHDPQYISYTATGVNSGSFTKYDKWDRIAFWGGAAIKMTENYQNILYDAEAGFTGNGFAEISITSHADGEEVGAGTTHLIGTIHSGSLLVDKLQVFVNQQMIELAVPENGVFGVDVPIQPGQNTFHFTTWGHSGSTLDSLFIPNDHPQGTFSLQGNPAPAVLSVTLTWSRDDTDVDLYVIDPTGDYSSFSHPNTADGGELSIDNETGYGPEYWALRTDDTVRYGETYRLRAHYYDDRGHGGVILVAKIVENEGTPQQQITTKFLYLASSDSGNTDPLATGSDWKDIGVFSP